MTEAMLEAMVEDITRCGHGGRKQTSDERMHSTGRMSLGRDGLLDLRWSFEIGFMEEER